MEGSVGSSVGPAKLSHWVTKSISGVPSPSKGANARAELVVPRSIPMEKRAWAFVKTYLRERALFRADLELHLPSAIGVRVLHPKLKDAELCDDGVHADRHHLPRRDIAKRWNLDFEQASVLKIAFGVRQDLSRCVAASHRGGEEPKLRRAAGDKTELASLDQQFCAFLHPLRDNAQRLKTRARIAGALKTPPLNKTAVGISTSVLARGPTRAASFSLAITFCRL